LNDIKNSRGLTPLSPVDGVVTHDNQHVNDMTVAFAQTLPVASQVLDVGAIVSDETSQGEKLWAAVSLMSDFVALLAGPAARVSAYDDVFDAAKPAKQAARNAGRVADVVETPAQQAARTAKQYAANVGQQKRPHYEFAWKPYEIEGYHLKGEGSTIHYSKLAVRRADRHHLLPDEHRAWFAERGFTNIDGFCIELDQGTHTAIHSMKWNEKLIEHLEKIEDILDRRLLPHEIWRVVDRFRVKWGLPGELVNY
jgi:hypothetical protein